MSVAIFAVSTCDWCGFEVRVEYNHQQNVDVRPNRWGLRDALLLCPDCWPAYDQAIEEARQKHANEGNRA